MRRTLAALVLALASIAATAAPFKDPLDTPAILTPRAAQSPMLAVARAGSRLVAVGLRGVIVYSDDRGASWQQATSPVSTDLVAVDFVSPQLGWASGHDGVILHSGDGGKNWSRQIDGRTLHRVIGDHYAETSSEAGSEAALKQAQGITQDGAALALLGIAFTDEQRGYAVGAFGLIVGTSDGGRSWQPLLHLIDNPQGLHLNAIRRHGKDLFIAAERGTVFRHDGDRFSPHTTSYSGSFFDLVSDGEKLLAFGLRGNAFRSEDGGLSWTSVTTGIDSGVTAGIPVTGGFVLLSQGGRAIRSQDGGKSFTPLRLEQADLFSGAVNAGEDQLIAVGLRGITRLRGAHRDH